MSHDPQPRFSVMMPPGTTANDGLPVQDVHTDDEAYARYVHAHHTKQGVHAVLVDHHKDLDAIADMLEERAAMEEPYAW